uniref:Uncharacterized protein n=1 Tax=Romanomermis culicivorax TaxID=13658 RepID=A0A915KE35_ROMCU
MNISTSTCVVLPPTTSSIGHQKPRNIEMTSRSSPQPISLDGDSGDSACFAAFHPNKYWHEVALEVQLKNKFRFIGQFILLLLFNGKKPTVCRMYPEEIMPCCALLTSTLSSAARQCVTDQDDALLAAGRKTPTATASSSLPSSLATPPPSPPQQQQQTQLGLVRGELDTKIAQVVDDVKSHLLNAVRSEVETLKQQIFKLERKVSDLLYENKILRQYVPDDVLSQLPPPQSPAPDDRRCSPPLPSLQCVF